MASTDVEICNMALTRIGVNPISSLNDGTLPAQTCDIHYAQTISEILSEHDWAFAISTASLAQSAGTNHSDYDHIYQLPVDFHHMVEVVGVDPLEQDWQVIGTKLACNLDTCTIRYVRNVSNVGEFPAWFVTLAYLRVASKVAYRLVQSIQIESNMLQLYGIALARAKQIEAMNAQPVFYHDPLFAEID